LQSSYRKDGLDTNAALARLRERRAAVQMGAPAQQGQAFYTPAPVQAYAQASGSPLAALAAPAQVALPQPTPPTAPQFLGDDAPVDLNIGGAPTRVALGELKRGYLRNADYTQRMQQLAEQVRQAQQARAAFEAGRVQMEARLPALLAAGASRFENGPIDWQKIAHDDPLGYAKLDAEFKEYQRQKADAQALMAVRANEAHQQKLAVKQWADEWLNGQLPGWRDPGTRNTIQQLLTAHLLEVGYTAEEIQNMEILDPRQLVVAEESRQFRAMVRAEPSLLRNLGARPAAPALVHSMPGNGLLQRGGGATNAATAYERFSQLRDDPRTSGRARQEAAVAVIAARRRGVPAMTPLSR
jgi:hypothetical protein